MRLKLTYSKNELKNEMNESVYSYAGQSNSINSHGKWKCFFGKIALFAVAQAMNLNQSVFVLGGIFASYFHVVCAK